MCLARVSLYTQHSLLPAVASAWNPPVSIVSDLSSYPRSVSASRAWKTQYLFSFQSKSEVRANRIGCAVRILCRGIVVRRCRDMDQPRFSLQQLTAWRGGAIRRLTFNCACWGERQL